MSLPPHLERIHDELMSAAAHRTTSPRRSPRRIGVAVAFATLAVGGAALAATGTNPIAWLRGGDPAREIRVVPDPTARVDGTFPQAIVCTGPQDAARCRPVPGWTCTTVTDGGREVTSCGGPEYRLAAGERRLELMTRVVARPHLDAEVVRTALAGFPPDAALFPDAPAPYRDATARGVLAAAQRLPREFWDGMETLVSLQGGSTSVSDPDHPDRELVPPAGIPRFLTCVDDHGLRCHPPVRGASLPVGAPIYALQPDDGWRSVPRPVGPVTRWDAVMTQVFGRPLTPDEQLVLATAMLPARTGTSDGTAVQATTAPAPTTQAAPARP